MLAAIALYLLGQADSVKVEFALDISTLHKTYSFKEVTFEPITDPKSQLEITQAIRQELGRYPPKLIKKTLASVALTQKFAFDGVPYGGTYLLASKQIILNVFLNDGKWNEDWLRESVHHEYSSFLLILNRKNFPEQDWLKANDPSILYGFTDQGFEAMKQGRANSNFDPALEERGFVCQYGTSDMENDFNTFAGAIMGPRCEDFWKAALKFPRLRTKAEIFLRFYKRIDKSFELPSTVPAEIIREVNESKRSRPRSAPSRPSASLSKWASARPTRS